LNYALFYGPFFSVFVITYVYLFVSQTAHFSVKKRNAILTSGNVIISDEIYHPAIIKHGEINRVMGNRVVGNRVMGNRVMGNRVMGNQMFDATMNNFPLFVFIAKISLPHSQKSI